MGGRLERKRPDARWHAHTRTAHLHKGVEEDEGVVVDVRDGLGLARLPGLLALILAPDGLVQLRQLPGLCDHRAAGAARPAIQRRLLEPGDSTAKRSKTLLHLQH